MRWAHPNSSCVHCHFYFVLIDILYLCVTEISIKQFSLQFRVSVQFCNVSGLEFASYIVSSSKIRVAILGSQTRSKIDTHICYIEFEDVGVGGRAEGN